MRVLWLTHPESDYAASMLVDAFTSSNSGVECIDFYPHKWSYFGETHHYSLPNIPNGCTAPGEWMEPVPESLVHLAPANANIPGQGHYGLIDGAWANHVCESLDNGRYDLVVLESQRMCVQQAMVETNVAHYVNKFKIPCVVLDGEDYWEVLRRVSNLRIDIMLKREYTHRISVQDRCLDGDTETLIVAYPFCTTRRMEYAAHKTSWQPNDADASMSVGDTFAIRRETADALLASSDLNVQVHTNIANVNGAQTLLPWSDYIARARKSRCAIVPRGWGLDTLRFWEMLPTTILCAQKTDLILSNTFSHMQNIMWWSTPQECVECVRWLKDAPPRLVEDIYMSANEHMRKHHTSAARMRHILELIDNVCSMKNLRRPEL